MLTRSIQPFCKTHWCTERTHTVCTQTTERDALRPKVNFENAAPEMDCGFTVLLTLTVYNSATVLSRANVTILACYMLWPCVCLSVCRTLIGVTKNMLLVKRNHRRAAPIRGVDPMCFFWVLTHPLFSSWDRMGIGPTHFLRLIVYYCVCI